MKKLMYTLAILGLFSLSACSETNSSAVDSSVKSTKDAKCGSGKCGKDMKCGKDKKCAADMKCGAGKCGKDKKPVKKCGTGKCGK
jgi:uncharacterized low-complexity protein